MAGTLLRFSAILESTDPGAPLTVTFDAALAALESLPRMFIEPDGSFVWRGTTADGSTWQLDGNLIDRGEVLDRVDLHGRCPRDKFDDLLRALGWPQAPLAFQLTHRGLTLSESDFRARASFGEAV